MILFMEEALMVLMFSSCDHVRFILVCVMEGFVFQKAWAVPAQQWQDGGWSLTHELNLNSSGKERPSE